jgi:hypothetical protein
LIVPWQQPHKRERVEIAHGVLLLEKWGFLELVERQNLEQLKFSMSPGGIDFSAYKF